VMMSGARGRSRRLWGRQKAHMHRLKASRTREDFRRADFCDRVRLLMRQSVLAVSLGDGLQGVSAPQTGTNLLLSEVWIVGHTIPLGDRQRTSRIGERSFGFTEESALCRSRTTHLKKRAFINGAIRPFSTRITWVTFSNMDSVVLVDSRKQRRNEFAGCRPKPDRQAMLGRPPQ